ncbi:MAG TPA: nucleotidyltransferase family protein [Gemmatimonadaceae bacterium]|nr:nucleotidyltransferase family protein [Gemmatimonadaceae bacterium]
MISALLLAAGAARRFGAPKLLEDLHGKPVIRWSASVAIGPPVDELVVVVPPNASSLRAALDGIDARFVVNPRPELGLASSIACGAAALDRSSDAVLVLLGDEPATSRTAVEQVVAHFEASTASIVVPTYEGVRGHPVLFARSVIPELREFTGGDVGARALVDRVPSRVAFVELGMSLPPDIDTPGDLARLREQPQYISPPSTQRP